MSSIDVIDPVISIFDLQTNDGLRVSRRNHGNERFNLVIPCFFCN